MAVDWNGTSDPYAILAVDKQSVRSSMIKRKLNPIWNETFMFHIDLQGTHPSAAAEHSAGKTLEDQIKIESDSLSVPAAPARATSESSSSSSSWALSKSKKKARPPLPSRNLSVLLFDHDWVRHDHTLGWFEVDLNTIPRDRYVERTFVLQGAKNGEVTLSLQRCTLTSPHMQRILKTLVSLGRPIKQSDLATKSVSLRQLLGREPYITLPSSSTGNAASSPDKKPHRRSKNASTDMSSGSSGGAAPAVASTFGGHSIQFIPALSHLASLIVDPRSRFSANNQRTLHKVLYILRSQQVVDLALDLPTRVLWFSNLSSGVGGDESLSASSLFITLRKHFPNRIKRMLIPGSRRQGCVYVGFKRVEDAILALLTMLDLRPLRACFGQAFEPRADHLLFGAIKAGILHMAGPFSNAAGAPPGQGVDAQAAAGMSDDLPPMPDTKPGPIGGMARAISLARQNSNCNNDAPTQKAKHELDWAGYWLFVSAPNAALGRPAILHALARTEDLDPRDPEASKFFFRIELTPNSCVVARSGAWSIELIDHTPLPGEEAVAAAAAEPASLDDVDVHMAEASSGAGAAAAGAGASCLSVPGVASAAAAAAAAPRTQRSYFIRSHSAPVIEEWFELLKALRNGTGEGEALMSPHKGPQPQPSRAASGSIEQSLASLSLTPSSPSSSPALAPASGADGGGLYGSPPRVSSLSLSSGSAPMSPLASQYFEESSTRVFCNSCNRIKSILDIYTLDAALDVAPTHPDAASVAGGPIKDPALLHMHLPISPPSSGARDPSHPSSLAPPQITQFTIAACVDCLKSRIASLV